MNEHVNPVSLHAPVAAYSHQVRVPSTARWLVVSGQIGMRPDGEVPADAGEQLSLALDNVAKNLQADGMAVTDLVKLTIFLAGDIDPDQRRQRLEGWLGAHRPAMTLVRVAGLAAPALQVEVEALAAAAES